MMKYWFYVAISEKMETIQCFCESYIEFFPLRHEEKKISKEYNRKFIITHYKEISKEEYEFQTGGEG